MGLNDDLERFREVGEQRREDLADFIKHGQLGHGDIKVPIKVVELPEFQYDQWDQGGVGQGDAEEGDPVDTGQPQPGDGDDGEPGDESGEHGYYEMNPEEFAEELDDELGLDLEPKGKSVVEEVEGDLTDLARTGPDSTLDFERMFKKGLKRKLALDFDEEYLRKVLQVDGIGPQTAFEWARGENIPVSKGWLEREYADIPRGQRALYDSIAEIAGEPRQPTTRSDFKDIPLRQEDKRYKYPEIIEKKQKNVVVVNIRDVSGSMRKSKRELVERVFTPMDWYLTGKYDHAEFVYIAHDRDAWQVEREDFFGIRSGGGTKISSAYDLAKQILDDQYPWAEWNRYVFAAGDGENSNSDSRDNVVPLMEEEIPANLHAYVETKPGRRAMHGDVIENELGNQDNVAVSVVNDRDDVLDAIYDILSTEDGGDSA